MSKVNLEKNYKPSLSRINLKKEAALEKKKKAVIKVPKNEKDIHNKKKENGQKAVMPDEEIKTKADNEKNQDLNSTVAIKIPKKSSAKTMEVREIEDEIYDTENEEPVITKRVARLKKAKGSRAVEILAIIAAISIALAAGIKMGSVFSSKNQNQTPSAIEDDDNSKKEEKNIDDEYDDGIDHNSPAPEATENNEIYNTGNGENNTGYKNSGTASGNNNGNSTNSTNKNKGNNNSTSNNKTPSNGNNKKPSNNTGNNQNNGTGNKPSNGDDKNQGTTTPDDPGTTKPDDPGTTTPDDPGTTTPDDSGTTKPDDSNPKKTES